MQALSHSSGVQLLPASDDQSLLWNQWRQILSFGGGWNGQVVIQCATKEEITAIHKAAKETMIEVQGHLGSMDISSNWVDL